MIFISAGHNTGGLKPDPGAIANGYMEAGLTVIIRNKVLAVLTARGVPFVSDKDSERLAEYLDRIKTGEGSVVLEFHFDASSPTASGCTALIEEDFTSDDKEFAWALSRATSEILKIRNRGVFTESQSHRGKLGLMKENGIICLLEICFLTNQSDVDSFVTCIDSLAEAYADILIEFEKRI
jgi:N-acetylmuramoyl-L-alanine amidase